MIPTFHQSSDKEKLILFNQLELITDSILMNPKLPINPLTLIEDKHVGHKQDKDKLYILPLGTCDYFLSGLV